jgi:hypothetical protein
MTPQTPLPQDERRVLLHDPKICQTTPFKQPIAGGKLPNNRAEIDFASNNYDGWVWNRDA